MKKRILIPLLFIVCSVVSAQAYEGKGDMKINAGLNAYGYGAGVSGSIDFGILEWLSVGGGTKLYFTDNKKDESFFVFGRANFHLGQYLNMPSKWDVYPGLNLGLLGDTFGWNAYLGARYFFNETWGIYTELGSNGSLGVSINL